MECRRCGYDLQGLPRPHRCPECGDLEDPPAEREEVVKWFASKRGFWLKEPPQPLYPYLGDPRCVPIARRRATLLCIVPWAAIGVSLWFLGGICEVSSVQRTGRSGPDRLTVTSSWMRALEGRAVPSSPDSRLRFSLQNCIAEADSNGLIWAGCFLLCAMLLCRWLSGLALAALIDSKLRYAPGEIRPMIAAWMSFPSAGLALISACGLAEATIGLAARLLGAGAPRLVLTELVPAAGAACYLGLGALMAASMADGLCLERLSSPWLTKVQFALAWLAVQLVVALPVMLLL